MTIQLNQWLSLSNQYRLTRQNDCRVLQGFAGGECQTLRRAWAFANRAFGCVDKSCSAGTRAENANNAATRARRFIAGEPVQSPFARPEHDPPVV